jgi:hypothetical protein
MFGNKLSPSTYPLEFKHVNPCSTMKIYKWVKSISFRILRLNTLYIYIETNEQSGLNGFANLSFLQGFEALTNKFVNETLYNFLIDLFF